ncbi:LysM peptidoglycan-binding domain-containing protein [Thalassobacillus pellis]|uniref:LysM peptidoglycan-binding domain-containing protein n=1 Tax=Thalassobacillus pellis TaxID=748008 RepID=UPI00195F8442|nr:stage VI sporulation protein D [Thalassobacillus pellis]
MTSENNNVFTFYLDEALWFERGQEVKELMGISLDPEIVIHPQEENVLIQGTIDLTGEYFVKDPSDNSEPGAVAPFPSRKLIDNVERSEEGASQFFHQFPVEVSIPRNRVDNIDNVAVSIDVFDYELPASNQLKLHATVAIHGIEEAARESVSESLDEERNEGEQQEWNEPYSFEVNLPFEGESSSQEDSGQEEDEKEESSSGDRWKYKKVQSFSEFFNTNQPPVEVEEEGVEVNESPSSSTVLYLDEDDGHTDESSSPQRQEGNQLLFSMFEEREETYTKMKMCIVQEDDTLETIADKYQVSKTNLTKVNNVFEDDLKPGKILYIPTHSS